MTISGNFLGVRLIKVSFKVNKGNKFQVSLYSDPGGTLEKIKQPETLARLRAGFQNPGICLLAFPSFPSPPPPLFHFLALVLFFARPKPKIPFLVVPRAFFSPKPNGNACHATGGVSARNLMLLSMFDAFVLFVFAPLV